ncbi:MAG TPA: hypothetical protein DEB31_02365 [Clostridiales bacterium]|nr:hypothetical protein [Clostridiales bacterium]
MWREQTPQGAPPEPITKREQEACVSKDSLKGADSVTRHCGLDPQSMLKSSRLKRLRVKPAMQSVKKPKIQ